MSKHVGESYDQLIDQFETAAYTLHQTMKALQIIEPELRVRVGGNNLYLIKLIDPDLALANGEHEVISMSALRGAIK